MQHFSLLVKGIHIWHESGSQFLGFNLLVITEQVQTFMKRKLSHRLVDFTQLVITQPVESFLSQPLAFSKADTSEGLKGAAAVQIDERVLRRF